MQTPIARRFFATAILALALVGAPSPATAASATALKDASGVLTIDASGKWREQKSDFTIAATGFLGVKRAELFAQVYDDEKAAAGAAKRWTTWRTEQGGDPQFTYEGEDALHFTAHSTSAGTVDYVRALDGAGKSAVVWVRVTGAPGVAEAEALAILNAAQLAAPAASPESGAGAGTGAGAETEGGGATEPEDPGAENGQVQKDPDFRLQIVLPEGFELRRDIKGDGRRVISAIGKVGTDDEAFLDLYLFDEYLRADAAGKWWMARERIGWRDGVAVTGDFGAFKVEVAGETWTRHVRVVATDAGIVGVKIDAASQADKAALTALDQVLGSLKVLKQRPLVSAAPEGLKTLASEQSILYYAISTGTDAPKAEDLLHEADVVEEHVQALLGDLAPRDGRKAVLRVYATPEDLKSALRPLGITDDRDAYWWVLEGAVLTHSAVISTEDGQAALRGALARSAMQRRLGFRAPFWLEAGGAMLIGSSAYNRGRIDLLHPKIMGLVRDVAPNGVEHETVRWWTREGSAEHPDRDAVSWSFLYFFRYGGQSGVKWKSAFDEYVSVLASTGDPDKAGEAFDFARNVELAEDWKKWARRL